MFVETCIAPVNIALIKYWGKRDEELILPINDSLSATLSTDDMCAKTTAAAAASFADNVMWLNGEEVPFEQNPRLMRCLKELQQLAIAKGNLKFPIEWKLHIASRNNFPTAAGLASSAAGYACLVYTLAQLYGVESEELTAIARQGSGSACRSLHGGFVRWHMGTDHDGTDSVALPIVPAEHWQDFHILILVVNDSRKKTSSTVGMKRCVETSDLLKYRAQHCVPQRIAAITDAIKQHDFPKLAEITMRDTNQFHAIALDTFPPCVYMNDVSHAIVEFVHAFNKAAGEVKLAYSFDAGPNACLFLLEKDVSTALAAIQTSFPNDAGESVEYVKGIPIKCVEINAFSGDLPKHDKNLFKYIIHTRIGTGPQRLDKSQSLLNISTGLPFEN
ncbi:diphosphomevalonate decarboxylase [Zeugodacus cucurbitae]|uniref:Diphosphomevalonate decarboxylase n=1 Tax=Zeugodacus cucurbitae TaxID=28588 RepID=A0A0A1XBR8_ZEUCU|nr:diphosphomevalonate decarboxylase [Zeugodacus cucurbitae]